MKTLPTILLAVSCCCLPVFSNANSTHPHCFRIVGRSKWGARPPLETEHVDIPLENVVVHHTATETCETEIACLSMVKKIQDYHMDKQKYPDIGYNFLVGGDENVYEGTGWHHKGSHTHGFNNKMLGVAFMGNFGQKLPTPGQIQAFDTFLKCAVNMLELTDDYKLYGARQVRDTESPGDKLYEEVQKFEHYSATPPKEAAAGENHHDHHHR